MFQPSAHFLNSLFFLSLKRIQIFIFKSFHKMKTFLFTFSTLFVESFLLKFTKNFFCSKNKAYAPFFWAKYQTCTLKVTLFCLNFTIFKLNSAKIFDFKLKTHRTTCELCNINFFKGIL